MTIKMAKYIKMSILAICVTLGGYFLIPTISVYFQTTNVRLTTQIYPPFQIIINGKLAGPVPKLIRCALVNMNATYTTEVLQWANAQMEVLNNNADGFYSAAKTPERDSFAEASNPVAVQNIVWVSLKENTKTLSDPNTKVGVFLNSGVYSQIKKTNTKIAFFANIYEDLIGSLTNKITDFIILDESVFDTSIELLGFNTKLFNKQPAYKSYLNVYFGKKFLEKSPKNFMNDFNNSLKLCGDNLDPNK